MKYSNLTPVFAALAIEACATAPERTMADEIQSSGFGSLSADWRAANDAVLAAYAQMDVASRNVQRGEKQVAQAEADIDRGENMIQKGNREKRDAERAIARARANLDGVEAKYQSALNGAAILTPSQSSSPDR